MTMNKKLAYIPSMDKYDNNPLLNEYEKTRTENQNRYHRYCYAYLGLGQRKADWLRAIGLYETAEIFTISLYITINW